MKLVKDICEICKATCKERALVIHHIIPRCDERCTNLAHNLAILCSSCHDLVHCGEYTIIGVYNTTSVITKNKGRSLYFFKKGEQPPIEKEFWLIKDNPKVITRKSL